MNAFEAHSRVSRGGGAKVAQLIPDQKVESSSLFRLLNLIEYCCRQHEETPKEATRRRADKMEAAWRRTTLTTSIPMHEFAYL